MIFTPTRNRSSYLLVMFFASISCFTSLGLCIMALGQSEAPRAEYYAAREVMDSGRLVEANEGFQMCVARAMQVNGKPWIDSIPPLVMQAECARLQGKLAKAMGLYDTALLVFLEHPFWLNQLRFSEESLQTQDVRGKAIQWFRSDRQPTVLTGIEPGLLTVDLGQGPASAPQPMALVTRVDAAEVIRCIGLAICRRQDLLGPLGKHSLNQRLGDALSKNLNQSTVWLRSSWTGLRGLHLMASASPRDGLNLLRNGAFAGREVDYFMTSLIFMRIGKHLWQEGDVVGATTAFQEATMAAARSEQWMFLAEALQLVAGASSAGQRYDLVNAIQSAAQWSTKRNPMALAYGHASAAELAIAAGNASMAESNLKAALSAVRTNEQQLPMLQAYLAYLNAQMAFQDNRRPLAQAQVETMLTIVRGDGIETASPTVFQLRQTMHLLNAQKLPAADGERLLNALLQDPSTYQWESSPMESLAAITTSPMSPLVTALRIAESARSDERVVECMDQILRQRLYDTLPFGGRQLAWKAAVCESPTHLNPKQIEDVAKIVVSEPTLANSLAQVRDLKKAIRGNPIPLDDKRIPGDVKRRLQDYSKAVDQVENQLGKLTLKRKHWLRDIPYRGTVDFIRKHLSAGDLLIGFVVEESQLWGTAITSDHLMTWHVDALPDIQLRIGGLLNAIGLPSNSGPVVSQVNALDAEWRSLASDLMLDLLPVEVMDKLQKAERLVIVPDGPLWYLPFELLPVSGDPNDPPLLAEHRLIYLPTFGSVPFANSKADKSIESLCISGLHFATDKPTNELFLESLFNTVGKMPRLEQAARRETAIAQGLKVQLDQVVVLSRIESLKRPFDCNLFPIDGSRHGQTGSWLDTPLESPSRLLFVGYQSQAQKGQIGDGMEFFLPTCSLLYGGSKSILLSRWNAGGRSSHYLLTRYLQELDRLAASQAWQRAAIALWAEELPISDEPILLPTGRDQSALTPGTHPKLWSGYMTIGDTCK